MTKQERTVIYFLIAMLILGLAVKFYRSKADRIDLKIESQGHNLDIQNVVREKQIVKINTASVKDFTRLPGIGPELAKRIVEYRNQNASFSCVEDIKKVKGIGPKKYDAIKDYLAVD